MEEGELGGYSAHVEVFIALRDVDYHYTRDGLQVKSPCKTMARSVTAYWKPPGALQWVEKCVTETIFREKNPKYATKLYLNCEASDAPALPLKFDVHDQTNHSLLGSVEVTLDVILKSSATGLELPIFSLIEPYQGKRSESSGGRLFLRAELLKRLDYAVLLKFGLRTPPSKCCCLRPPTFPFYYEIYKLNEETLFEVNHPYTLIHRSELIQQADSWNYIVLPVSRVCNGDLGRVLKLAVYQADHPGVPKGFALTTLRRMLVERELVVHVNRLDGKVSRKLCLYVPLCHEVPLHPSGYYMGKGLSLRRVFAVDLSVPSHPCEEALLLTASAMSGIAQGDSVFLTYGQGQPSSVTVGGEQYIRTLLMSYRDALHGLLKLGPASIQCVPKATSLSPLLNDIANFISHRTDHFEYHIVFIFTDGRIPDLEQAMPALTALAPLPLSLIFIVLGLGDLGHLLTLEKDSGGIRRIAHVLHFRSMVEWDTAVRTSHFRSAPADLFRREICTVIRDGMPAWMRIFQTAI